MGFLNEIGLKYFLSKLNELRGRKNGLAPLDFYSKVPVANLPLMDGAKNSTVENPDGQYGTSGIVPQPTVGDEFNFLRGDGRWVALPIYYTDSSVEYLGGVPEGSIWLKQKSSS